MKNTFEEVHARPDPTNLLKINSFAGIFRDFASILTSFLLICNFPRTPLFPEHLPVTASVPRISMHKRLSKIEPGHCICQLTKQTAYNHDR